MEEAAAEAASNAVEGMVTGDIAQALEALDMLYGDDFILGYDEQGWWAARHEPGGGFIRAVNPVEPAEKMNGEGADPS